MILVRPFHTSNVTPEFRDRVMALVGDQLRDLEFGFVASVEGSLLQREGKLSAYVHLVEHPQGVIRAVCSAKGKPDEVLASKIAARAKDSFERLSCH